MKVTTRGRYAVIAIVDLARACENSKPVPLSEIAERQKISLSYLEQLFAGLRRRNIVRSYRGPGGGYVLAREPDDISIADIMAAAEDSVPAKRNISEDRNSTDENCPTHDLWEDLGNLLQNYFRSITLGHVLRGEVNKVDGVSLENVF